jgi:hypothetical protein
MSRGAPRAPSGPSIPPEEDTYPQVAVDRGPRRRWILDHAKHGGVGAEIGVFRGHFAVEIAQHLEPAKLYLVDPWTRSGERFEWGDIPETNHNRLTTAQAFADARARMAPFADEVDIEFVEQWSYEFCRDLTHPLDWAYIDASHDYEGTLVDLEAVDSVLAEDGVIMGDDWITDPEHGHAGVLRAVNDFIRCREYELVAAGAEMQWCIRRTPPYTRPRHWLPHPLAPEPGDRALRALRSLRAVLRRLRPGRVPPA